jgi:cell division transport system permease protein
MLRRRTRILAFESTRDEQDETFVSLRSNMPLVPPDSIAGRALVTVVAIMTFLASLTVGGAMLVDGASRGWSRSISDEMTIQIIPTENRDTAADVQAAAAVARRTPGLADVRVYSSEEAAHMLEPWLGQGLDLSELPIPRLIALRRLAGRAFDEAAFKTALGAAAPSARLDDHDGWTERLTKMAHSAVVFAFVIFVLVLVATAMAVGFATRGAMADSRAIIDVLHFVGAEDRYVTRQFQAHFLRLGLRGGLIGGVCAILAFGGSKLAASLWAGSAGADQMAALFGVFSLGFAGYAMVAVIAVGVAVLTAFVSRSIVFRHLRTLT